MTFDGYTITLTRAELDQLFAEKPKCTGREYDEFNLMHTYYDGRNYLELNCYFYTEQVLLGVWNIDPTRDNSWNKDIIDKERGVEFYLYLCLNGETTDEYTLCADNAQEITDYINNLDF